MQIRRCCLHMVNSTLLESLNSMLTHCHKSQAPGCVFLTQISVTYDGVY